MSTHTSENDIREEIVTSHPILHNVKRIQKLDEYIKELSPNYKKLSILNQEKRLKGTQEKVPSIIGPLTILQNIMEAEQEALPENNHEANSGQMEITFCLNKALYL